MVFHHLTTVAESKAGCLPMEPLAKIGLDELFGSGAPGEAQPQRAALSVQTQVDIEEWAAEVFSRRPLGDSIEGRTVEREFEFVAIGELMDLFYERLELW